MDFITSLLSILTPQVLSSAMWGFSVSFGLCVLLVLTKGLHGPLSMDSSEGVQKFHTAPTPRVGGIPIVLALIVAWGKSPLEVREMLTTILIAGIPAFIFGLAEDISKRIGVAQRLLATMASGLLAWWISDYSLTRLDVWGLDWLMKFSFVSLVFTAFAVGGVANAINIIDGFNGLASTASTLAFLGYAVMAHQLGDNQLASVSLILAACVLGFFWVNWPLGKIFLGDGGSYFLGFALAWVAVMLIERNPAVSTFAVLTVCVHPVIEVVFSIYRRKVKRMSPGHPDRLHFHSLVKQRYIRRWFSSTSMSIRNSLTGLIVGGMTVVAAVVANLFYDSPALSISAFVVLGLGYVAIYARIVRYRWCSPITFLLLVPVAKTATYKARA